MFIRNFDSFTVCGGAEWSAAGFPLDTRASLHTEEPMIGRDLAHCWARSLQTTKVISNNNNKKEEEPKAETKGLINDED